MSDFGRFLGKCGYAIGMQLCHTWFGIWPRCFFPVWDRLDPAPTWSGKVSLRKSVQRTWQTELNNAKHKLIIYIHIYMFVCAVCVCCVCEIKHWTFQRIYGYTFTSVQRKIKEEWVWHIARLLSCNSHQANLETLFDSTGTFIRFPGQIMPDFSWRNQGTGSAPLTWS